LIKVSRALKQDRALGRTSASPLIAIAAGDGFGAVGVASRLVDVLLLNLVLFFPIVTDFGAAVEGAIVNLRENESWVPAWLQGRHARRSEKEAGR
jgi:hypothetical protein